MFKAGSVRVLIAWFDFRSMWRLKTKEKLTDRLKNTFRDRGRKKKSERKRSGKSKYLLLIISDNMKSTHMHAIIIQCRLSDENLVKI